MPFLEIQRVVLGCHFLHAAGMMEPNAFDLLYFLKISFLSLNLKVEQTKMTL